MISTLSNIIENSAHWFPDKEAFRCGTGTLTFAELNTKVNQLAKHLTDSGIKKGDRVGIYMNRCIETSIAIYGIMKSGAAYVPLDSGAPHSRTRFLIENCEIDFLVTTPKQKKRISKLLEEKCPIIQIIGISDDINITGPSWDTIFSISLENYKKVNVIGSDLAYVMYTSGSTGAPKGIMHTHTSGLAYAKLSANLYGLTPEDRVANHAPLHFDISTFGYFSAPLKGATTVIISDAHTKLPVSLAQLMEKEKLTIWYSVPLALIQLHLSGVLDKYDLSTLRWVIYGGENFTIKYLRELMQQWPHARFSNSYGPAEVNQCTYHHLENIPQLDSHIPIGKVWGENEFKLLDATNDEVIPGKPGELVVKTNTMMMGYWNDKILTKKSMFKEVIAPGIEHTYYRTGDMVRQNKAGDLIFLGRYDRQVKLRGHRIEMDEVEAVLTRHEEVKEAAVCLVEQNENEKILTAGVLLVAKSKIEARELVSFCKKSLPSYAVPEKIEVLSQFPKTSSGKTDLTALKNKLIAF